MIDNKKGGNTLNHSIYNLNFKLMIISLFN